MKQLNLRNPKQVSLFYDGGPYYTETSLLRKSMDWFLYNWDLRHERINRRFLTVKPEALIIHFTS